MAMDFEASILAATVAQRYYIEGHSKVQIAADLELSRFKVARLLTRSVEEGIVSFSIRAPLGIDVDLSEQVRQRYGLNQVVVVNVPDSQTDPQHLRPLIGRAAASLLGELITKDDVLGIGWGRTMSALASAVTRLPRCDVVQLGGIAGTLNENSLELVRRLCQASGGDGYPLFAPLVVKDALTLESLHSQPSIQTTMKRFDSVTVAAVAVGSWTPPESQLRKTLDDDELKRLTDDGVVGEVLATLLRADGSIVRDLDDRASAMDYPHMQKIPKLMLVAGGETKAVVVRAALRAHIGNMLVTDQNLAQCLLADS